MKNTRVVLVQRHPLLGEALMRIFQGVEILDLSYVDGGDPQQIERCLENLQPDIVVVAGEPWTVGPGDVLVFRGDQRHSYRNVSKETAVGYSVVLLARGSS
jgi:hypothetical protein